LRDPYIAFGWCDIIILHISSNGEQIVVDDIEAALKIIEIEGLAYALLDHGGTLISYSASLEGFVQRDGKGLFVGCRMEMLFPELIGYEDVLAELRATQGSHLQLERIYREDLHGNPGYITLRLYPNDDRWLLIVRDDTRVGLMEQRITQQRNDLSLLAARLERTRARLDDLLHRFMPGQVADVLMADDRQVALGGTRREITVLFADLRGFTNWASTREPEVVLTTLNSIFDDAIGILLESGATLDKFIGDAIMAFFNAPGDQPDHVARALDCARQICKLVFDECLQFGIGLNSGLVVAGNVGSLRAMQYTVIGDTVNVAKRLEERAGPGEILVGPGTMKLCTHHEAFVMYGDLQIKGHLHPIEVHQLL
jgi:class 3 adenylate cyclase